MKKYAVYKSDTGDYYYDYADTVEALEGSGFEEIITEDMLPVVFDGRGGYFRFNPRDYNFVELIETDKIPPLPLERMYNVNSPKFKLGWISPDGDTYSCGYTSHNRCAEMIVAKYYKAVPLPELKLHQYGWIQVIDSWKGARRQGGQYVHSEFSTLTRKQADKLYELGLYDRPEVQDLIKICEDEW